MGAKGQMISSSSLMAHGLSSHDGSSMLTDTRLPLKPCFTHLLAVGHSCEALESSRCPPRTSPDPFPQVLFYAHIHDGVVKGIKEVIQALERGEAQLVFLAEDCDEAQYVALVEAMCAEKGVYLLKVPEKKALGEMAGNTRLDDDGNVKKSCAASSVAVKDFGEQVSYFPPPGASGVPMVINDLPRLSCAVGGARVHVELYQGAGRRRRRRGEGG